MVFEPLGFRLLDAWPVKEKEVSLLDDLLVLVGTVLLSHGGHLALLREAK